MVCVRVCVQQGMLGRGVFGVIFSRREATLTIWCFPRLFCRRDHHANKHRRAALGPKSTRRRRSLSTGKRLRQWLGTRLPRRRRRPQWPPDLAARIRGEKQGLISGVGAAAVAMAVTVAPDDASRAPAASAIRRRQRPRTAKCGATRKKRSWGVQLWNKSWRRKAAMKATQTAAATWMAALIAWLSGSERFRLCCSTRTRVMACRTGKSGRKKKCQQQTKRLTFVADAAGDPFLCRSGKRWNHCVASRRRHDRRDHRDHSHQPEAPGAGAAECAEICHGSSKESDFCFLTFGAENCSFSYSTAFSNLPFANLVVLTAPTPRAPPPPQRISSPHHAEPSQVLVQAFVRRGAGQLDGDVQCVVRRVVGTA